MGKNWAGPFFPNPDKIKHQLCADGYLGGGKLGWSIIFPPWQVKASTLPCHEYTYNLRLLGGGGKTGPAHSFPTLTSESISLVQKLGYLGGEKLGWPILSPPRLVKVSTLLCHEYANNLCFLGGGEKRGQLILSPPWQDKAWTMCRWLSGWRKTGLVHYIPTLTSESINLTLSWIPWLIRRWGKAGLAHSFPTLTSESMNLVQKLGYLGGEKLVRPILSPLRLVKVSTLPWHEYANNLCFLRGGEKLGWPILSPPWLVKVSSLCRS